MGREFRVNRYGSEWQQNPDVVVRDGGGFALAHYETRLGTSGGLSTFGYEIQLFDNRGNPDGPRRGIDFAGTGTPDNIDLVQLRSDPSHDTLL